MEGMDLRKIENKTWMERFQNEKGEIEEKKADLANALGSLLIQNRDRLPKGMDAFRTFHQIQHAFEEAEKTGFIELEEAPYIFIKKIIETDISPAWAAKPEVFDAIEIFLKAEPDKK